MSEMEQQEAPVQMPKPANDPVAVDRLVDELLATGTMNEDTTADLGRIRAEWQAGTLDADDADYLVAFHRRILNDPAMGEYAAGSAPSVPRADVHEQLAQALARAEAAEAEVEKLRLEIEMLRAGQAPSAP
jgi:hypothetical protein